LTTARQAAERLGIPFDKVDWSYVGLNHRGFIVRLSHNDRDLIEEYVHRFGPEVANGVPVEMIDCLKAIPTKFFRLLFKGGEAHETSRARFLLQLRKQVAGELRQHPTVLPPSLHKRSQEWYPQAVAPMLVALSSPRPTFHVTNLLSPRGIVEECPARISSTSLQACETPRGSAAVEHWLEVFRSHELALLRAARCPSLETFGEAVRRDPIVPAEKAAALTKALWDTHEARRTAAGR